MVLVDVQSVGVSRPGRPLFADLSMSVAQGDRWGVVGINGTGKSTLLSILAGSTEPETGTVLRGRDVVVASIEQVTDLPPGRVSEAVEEGWRGESILDRLGMGHQLDSDVAELSGGEEKRVALARALVAEADLLILDEPTNHLDVDAIEWLEGHLSGFRGGLVIVTHDRHLLDRVATRVIELDRGRAYTYAGGYTAYLEGRARREEREVIAEATRRTLARRELAWLRRGAPARTRKSKFRVGAATKLIESGPEDPARRSDLDLRALHDRTPRLGDQVIELHDVTVGFDGRPPLVEGLDLLVDRRERLGIVGANGSGKSTLLEVMAGRREPRSGRVVIGPTAVVGVHDQQARDLDPALRVRDAVAGESEPSWWHAALLERFWFDSDVQRAPIELLSGGERRRLQLVLTLARGPNVLLLDEPTNDLDLDTLRVLEDFLEGWPGAVVVVSHDRAFLERTVDDVVVLDGSGAARRWPRGYEGWLEDRRRSPAPSSASGAGSAGSRPARPRSGRSSSTVRRALKDVESELERLEAQVSDLGEQVKSVAGDHLRLVDVTSELARVESELVDAEERWLRLSDELEP